MTLKTSLFNKGIYKSTLRRYMWGSILYFIILMLVSVFPIVLTAGVFDNSADILTNNGLILASVIISMFVPTVVALLAFRHIHSKRTSVFTHSLPVSRTSVYISTVAGSFTLMAVPVLATGFILLLMSVSSYSEYMVATSCLVWTGMNLLTLFLMFSCACIAANLTGNGFAAVVINGLIHGIVPLICIAANSVFECFLFGFKGMNEAISRVVSSNFAVWLGRSAEKISYTDFTMENAAIDIEFGRMVIYIVIAIVFYVLSWVLYKVRNIENAEDVAAFKCLNPIFKYLVTFVVTIGAFALFSQFIGYSVVVFAVFVITVASVAYFATEMILKKTFKVWRAYRGYLVFVALFTLGIFFVAFTSFFGFETKVPDADDVASVAVYNYYEVEEPFIGDGEFIKTVTERHRKFISAEAENILSPRMTKDFYTRLHIVYKLKNGDVLERAYYVNEAEKYEVLSQFYGFTTYKQRMEKFLNVDTDDIVTFNIHSDFEGNINIPHEKHEEFYRCICQDIENLEYNQIHAIDHSMVYVDIECRNDDYTEGLNVPRLDYCSISLNNNFKNSMKWLKENGYGRYVELKIEGAPLYVVYEDAYRIDIEKDKTYEFEGTFDKEKIIRIENEEKKDLVYNYFEEYYYSHEPDKSCYYVLCPKDENSVYIIGVIREDEIKEFEKLLNN